MKRFFIISAAFLCTIGMKAQQFDKYFEDNTLRLDYTFSGDSAHQEIFLDELNKTPGWAGRQVRLNQLPLLGNGQIYVHDAKTDSVIYETSFSTLFQEWQTTQEAARTRKSFENVFQIPFPKVPVKITVQLQNVHHKILASFTHTVDPKDILIRKQGFNKLLVTPHKYLWQGGDPKDCIDIAIMAEGYTKAEMPTFYKDAQIAIEQILKHEPFKTFKNRLNFVAVASPSADSGVSRPKAGKWISTAVNSHFDTFYSDRYLTTLHLKNVNNLLSGIPYEHIIILANTAEYGGGGIYNSYTLTTAHHPLFKPVVVHEFGHSFGGLADEYFYDDQYTTMYPSDTEPWEQNITTLHDFSSKWKDMLPENTKIPTPADGKNVYTKIGVYEGGGYQSKGVYRAFQECRMKINEAPAFCPVCQRALTRLIKFYTDK